MLHIEYVLDRDCLPAECIADCSTQGSVDEAVEYWQGKLAFSVDRANAIRCLAG